MIYLLPVVSFLFIIISCLKKFCFTGTLGAAQKLCVQLGYEVVETLVIIELLGLGGREKLTDVDHFTALTQFSAADFETIGADSDRVHQSKDE
jgi:hypothetical protein